MFVSIPSTKNSSRADNILLIDDFLEFACVIIFASKDDKIGLAVGVTDSLTQKYNAVDFAKKGSEIIGGKGGGGRPDFAQAGGVDSSKIDEALDNLKSLI